KALFEEAKQDHVAANDKLNDFYTQQFTTLKQKQCITMAALLETIKTTLSGLDAQLEQIQQDQKTQKLALLKKHRELFEVNETKLQTIAIGSPANSTTLEVSKK